MVPVGEGASIPSERGLEVRGDELFVGFGAQPLGDVFALGGDRGDRAVRGRGRPVRFGAAGRERQEFARAWARLTTRRTRQVLASATIALTSPSRTKWHRGCLCSRA